MGTRSPVAFVREILREKPYDKQVQILTAVARSRRVSVVGCNGSGKDWAAARVVLWWMYSRSPAKAIVTGPTTRQVDDIVWNEIRTAYSQSRGKLAGKMFKTARYELDEQNFALGFATNSPFNLQGFHSPNLLVVITEAHAVDKDDMDAIRRLNPKCLLMTGNPPGHPLSTPWQATTRTRRRSRRHPTPGPREGDGRSPLIGEALTSTPRRSASRSAFLKILGAPLD